MMKISLIVALALAGSALALQQDGGSEQNGAPEPYSYGYETDTHSAAEQKDPSGTVTGYYTIADADGRQRRVEYVADAAGFRAKVQTNEVGTKSANSADVEVIASPPNPEQLVYQAPQQQQRQQQVVQVQRQQNIAVQQPLTTTTQQRVVSQEFLQQQPPQLTTATYGTTGYGYYPGYAYGNTLNQRGYGNTFQQRAYGSNLDGVYAQGYPYGGQYGYQSSYASGYPAGSYYSYNNHLPSQYYRSVQTTSGNNLAGVQGLQGVQQPQQQGLSGGIRYITTTTSNNVQPAGGIRYQQFGRSGFQQSNQVLPAGASYSSSSSSQTRSSGSSDGSSNYILLKKRDAEAEKKLVAN